MEDLLGALSDYLLQSGFQDYLRYELPEASRRSTISARPSSRPLLNGELFDEEMREQIAADAMDGQLEELIEQLIERMQQEDYISSTSRMIRHSGRAWAARQARRSAGEVRDHRQEPRLPRLQNAARPAWIAGKIELWTPRYARYGDRHRNQRRLAARMNSAIRSTSTSPPHSRARSSARALKSRSTSNTAIFKSISVSTNPAARRS